MQTHSAAFLIYNLYYENESPNVLVSAKLDNGKTDSTNSFFIVFVTVGRRFLWKKKIRKLRGKL